jgi:hypothetical protein
MPTSWRLTSSVLPVSLSCTGAVSVSEDPSGSLGWVSEPSEGTNSVPESDEPLSAPPAQNRFHVSQSVSICGTYSHLPVWQARPSSAAPLASWASIEYGLNALRPSHFGSHMIKAEDWEKKMAGNAFANKSSLAKSNKSLRHWCK